MLFKVFTVVIECFMWSCSLVQYSLVLCWYLMSITSMFISIAVLRVAGSSTVFFSVATSSLAYLAVRLGSVLSSVVPQLTSHSGHSQVFSTFFNICGALLVLHISVFRWWIPVYSAGTVVMRPPAPAVADAVAVVGAGVYWLMTAGFSAQV